MDIYLKDKKPEIEMREESASLKEEKAYTDTKVI